jgi:serine/threonine-protein kinase
MMAAHLYEQPAPPTSRRPEVHPDLEDVVMRCLAKGPARRFPDVESLEAALSKCQCSDQWTKHDAEPWWRSHTRRDDCEAGTE